MCELSLDKQEKIKYNKFNNTIIKKIIQEIMKMFKNEITEKLLRLDEDMALLDPSAQRYSCVIVGGSALVMTDMIARSTHDIDSIASSEKLQPMLELYDINMKVKTYLLHFPDDYLSRLKPLPLSTKKVDYFTVSTEDLVVAKLSAGRGKDLEDIESPQVIGSLDWELLDRLVEDVCYGMLTDYDVTVLRTAYETYKERFQCEN